MGINVIAVAIPVFLVCMLAEFLWSKRVGRSVYRFNDAVTDLSCGVSQQATGVFSKLVTLGVYVWVYDAFAWLELSRTSWVPWVAGFFLYDVAYYAWHRFTHEVNIGWATHVVHHQSEDYNLAVALRQSMTSVFTSLPFYLPLAIIGIDPIVFAVHASISLLYQFWIHTELVGKLGPLEWVLNTPSHHRVHHAINPQYLDKNYAAVLIVWDRSFGTFAEEHEAPVYGTVKPLNSFNPVWANFWYLDLLWRDARAARTWGEWWRVWWGHPGYRPESLPPYPAPRPITPEEQQKYHPVGSVRAQVYVGIQHLVTVLGLVALLWVEKTAPWEGIALSVGLIVWSVGNLGGLFERRSWARVSEVVRWAVTALVAVVWLPGSVWAAGVAVLAGLSALSVWSLSPPEG